MIDTLTVIAYLLGNEPDRNVHLKLQASFAKKESPQLRWQGVPPETTSLALVVRNKNKYYWIVYNLPPQIKSLPYGVSAQMSPHDEGYNSWGQRNYHAQCTGNATPSPVTIELYALDKRFGARYHMTGHSFEQKIKNHVIAKTILQS